MPIIKLNDLALHVQIDVDVPFELNSYAHAQAVRVLNGLPADRGVQVILNPLDDRVQATPLAVAAMPEDKEEDPNESLEPKPALFLEDPDYPKYFKSEDNTRLCIYYGYEKGIFFCPENPLPTECSGTVGAKMAPGWNELSWAQACETLHNWHPDRAKDQIEDIRDYHSQFYEPPGTKPIVGDTLEMVRGTRIGRITAIDSYVRWGKENTSDVNCHNEPGLISSIYGPEFRVHKRITLNVDSALYKARVRPWKGQSYDYLVFLPDQKFAFGVKEPQEVRGVGLRRLFESDESEIFGAESAFVIRTVYNSKAYLEYVKANKLPR